MIDSTSAAGAPSLMAALMNQAVSAQNLEIAVVKKSQEIEKAQGEAALKLIDSAQPTNSLDVYA